jgi:acetolactate synthase-1/3 small subunit
MTAFRITGGLFYFIPIMKKASNPFNQFIFAIYAEDKKGLVGQVLIYFNRCSYDVKSMNVSRTDISDLVLITLEAEVPEPAIKPFTERLKKIIEVMPLRLTQPARD